MKTLGKVLLASVAASSLIAGAYAADLKIAVVDVAQILQTSPVVQQAKTSLQDKYKPQYNKIQAAQKQLQASIDNLKKNSVTMSADARKKLQDQIAQQQQSLISQQQTFQQQLSQTQQKDMQDVLSRLQDVIKSVANKDGYTLVLPKGAVAYAADNLDITSEVQKAFNAK